MTPEHRFAAESLRLLDPLPLECDGLARALSMLLARDGIEHQVHIGALSVAGVGRIPHHWWIELEGGEICDARARMWLGADERVPHGVFEAQAWQGYASKRAMRPTLSPVLFGILTGGPTQGYPRASNSKARSSNG
ncbi:hypothetical protein [Acidovorax sp.]|uniref:hypothetical protein n=1 Tax=Acidovorax sp. TaxID=1872122 RepID=UPI0027BAE16F|nr:hypothetical protein [Acidovorax sp.]